MISHDFPGPQHSGEIPVCPDLSRRSGTIYLDFPEIRRVDNQNSVANKIH